MAFSFSVSLLLVALITTASLRLTSASDTSAPSHPPSSLHVARRPPPPPPSLSPSPSPSISQSPQPPPAPAAIQEKQFGNIIDALIGTGDFGGWANLLSSANPSSLPLTATLFIPGNDAISELLSTSTDGEQFDPLLIPYHIVPQRLNFSDLQKLPSHTHLPTLLFSKFIVITNNSASNFTVHASQITQPDFYLTSAFTMHGIAKVLDYDSVFNSGGAPVPPPSMPQNSPWKKKLSPPRGIAVGERSDARHSCTRIPIILSTFFTLLFISRFFEI